MQYGPMQFFMPSGQEPVTWWGGRPISLTLLLIFIQIAALLLTTFMLAFRIDVVGLLSYYSELVLKGQVWRLVTYWVVIPPSLWAVVSMLMLWWFGVPVEQFMGWKKFLKFYLILCLVPAVVCLLFTADVQRWIASVLGWSSPGGMLMGPFVANAAVFIGFATIYPNAELLFGIKAKHFVWVYLAITLLQAIAYHSLGAVPYWISAGAAYAYLKFHGVQGGFAWLDRWREEREQVRFERAERKRELESKDHFISEQVDPILDKIARQGMQSLTEEEKRILERAKDKLR